MNARLIWHGLRNAAQTVADDLACRRPIDSLGGLPPVEGTADPDGVRSAVIHGASDPVSYPCQGLPGNSLDAATHNPAVEGGTHPAVPSGASQPPWESEFCALCGFSADELLDDNDLCKRCQEVAR